VTSDVDYAAVVPAPVGLLGVRMRAGQLLAIDFAAPVASVDRAPDGNLREVLDQLFHYFEDPAWQFDLPLAVQGTPFQRRVWQAHPAWQFDLPLAVQGTPFQRRVWQALGRIPSGTTRSYGELAAALGSSARAVGGACRRNPVPVVVPCHRVIAAGGAAGGFMGQRDGEAVAIKTWLLNHERGDL